MLNAGDRRGGLQEKRGRREGPAKLWELVVWYVHVSQQEAQEEDSYS